MPRADAAARQGEDLNRADLRVLDHVAEGDVQTSASALTTKDFITPAKAPTSATMS